MNIWTFSAQQQLFYVTLPQWRILALEHSETGPPPNIHTHTPNRRVGLKGDHPLMDSNQCMEPVPFTSSHGSEKPAARVIRYTLCFSADEQIHRSSYKDRLRRTTGDRIFNEIRALIQGNNQSSDSFCRSIMMIVFTGVLILFFPFRYWFRHHWRGHLLFQGQCFL